MSIIGKENRALLVVVNLSSWGVKKYQKLYEWLDDNAIALSKLILKSQYREVKTLSDDDVYVADFIEMLQALAEDDEIKAIDVFLSLHGEEGKLLFDDGRIRTRDLSSRIKALGIENKLRLCYSGACYGATHAQDFVNAGFRVASGALGVASNGAFDFPFQLASWAMNEIYEHAVRAGNFKLGIAISDTAARAMGFKDVNSKKVIYGDKSTRITSAAS